MNPAEDAKEVTGSVATYGRVSVDLSSAPTKVISQIKRLRALIPPLTLDRARRIADDPETTVLLSIGPETISARRLGLQPGTGRSAIPLNSRPYSGLPQEVAAYRDGYADGFVDSTTLRFDQL
jgi:hypothetical protein